MVSVYSELIYYLRFAITAVFRISNPYNRQSLTRVAELRRRSMDASVSAEQALHDFLIATTLHGMVKATIRQFTSSSNAARRTYPTEIFI